MLNRIELSPRFRENERPQEACGITAIFSKRGEMVSPLIPALQYELQHRGWDSAGMASFNRTSGKIEHYKNFGRVQEVFPDGFNFKEHHLLSDTAIGHNRYGTSGGNKKDEVTGAQPIIAEWNGRMIAIAYNGNLPEEERQKLKNRIPATMPQEHDFDTLNIAQVIVSADGNTWEERIKNGLQDIHLAYALTILTDEGKVYGLRCPTGTWPLWAGENEDIIIFASETRVERMLSPMRWREVKPGELVKAASNGIVSEQISPELPLFRCALHDVYGAKPDSKLTDDELYRAFRWELGQTLAREHPIDADVYTGIPESGIPIAEGYVSVLGREATSVFTLRDETRGFIAKNEDEINAVVSGKYAIDYAEFVKGKRVVEIDDSLIRGKTAGGDSLKGVKGVITLTREAGAREVHFILALPKFVKGCDMGYYIREEQLVALKRREDGTYEELDEQAVAQIVGADSIYYLSVHGVKDAYEKTLGEREAACMACMGQPHPLNSIPENDPINQRELLPSAP